MSKQSFLRIGTLKNFAYNFSFVGQIYCIP